MSTLNKKDIFQTGYFKQASFLVFLVTGLMVFSYLYEKKDYTPDFLFILGCSVLTAFLSLFANAIFTGLIKEKVSVTFIELNKVSQEQVKLSLEKLKTTHSHIVALSVIYGVFSACFDGHSFFESLLYNTVLNGGLIILFLESINKNALNDNKIPDGCFTGCLFGGFVAFSVSYGVTSYMF